MQGSNICCLHVSPCAPMQRLPSTVPLTLRFYSRPQTTPVCRLHPFYPRTAGLQLLALVTIFALKQGSSTVHRVESSSSREPLLLTWAGCHFLACNLQSILVKLVFKRMDCSTWPWGQFMTTPDVNILYEWIVSGGISRAELDQVKPGYWPKAVKCVRPT